MKRLLVSFVTVCLVGNMFAGEGFAQRGRRGGGRGRPSGVPATGAMGRPPAGPGIPGRQFQPLGRSDRPRHPELLGVPGRGGRSGGPERWRNLQERLGTAPAAPPGRNALKWIDPADQPFTSAWYAAHPKAWRPTHPHAGVAVAATVAGVARWLAVPYPIATVGGATTTTVVIEGEAADESSATAAEGVQVVTSEADFPSQWMSIGTFALKPTGQAEATRVIQLAVDHNGTIRGSHYDLISDDVRDVRGTVDKQELRVTWTVGENGRVVFEGPLDELTRPAGKVTARFPGGKSGSWETVQVTR